MAGRQRNGASKGPTDVTNKPLTLMSSKEAAPMEMGVPAKITSTQERPSLARARAEARARRLPAEPDLEARLEETTASLETVRTEMLGVRVSVSRLLKCLRTSGCPSEGCDAAGALLSRVDGFLSGTRLTKRLCERGPVLRRLAEALVELGKETEAETRARGAEEECRRLSEELDGVGTQLEVSRGRAALAERHVDDKEEEIESLGRKAETAQKRIAELETENEELTKRVADECGKAETLRANNATHAARLLIARASCEVEAARLVAEATGEGGAPPKAETFDSWSQVSDLMNVETDNKVLRDELRARGDEACRLAERLAAAEAELRQRRSGEAQGDAADDLSRRLASVDAERKAARDSLGALERQADAHFARAETAEAQVKEMRLLLEEMELRRGIGASPGGRCARCATRNAVSSAPSLCSLADSVASCVVSMNESLASYGFPDPLPLLTGMEEGGDPEERNAAAVWIDAMHRLLSARQRDLRTLERVADEVRRRESDWDAERSRMGRARGELDKAKDEGADLSRRLRGKEEELKGVRDRAKRAEAGLTARVSELQGRIRQMEHDLRRKDKEVETHKAALQRKMKS